MRLCDLLQNHPGIEVLRISAVEQKHITTSTERMAEADLVALCLPNDEVAEVMMAADVPARVLDCGPQMRLSPDWVYGLPELGPEQRRLISTSNRVSNPGCFASAFVLLTRPLVNAGLLAEGKHLSAFGVTGYSAGGKRMVASYETKRKTGRIHALSRPHRHIPEMCRYSGLTHAPTFIASVGTHKEGLVLTVPVPDQPKGELMSILDATYRDEPMVHYGGECPDTISPVSDKSSQIEIYVGGRDRNCLLVARMSNLLKGAASTAVQNINLMLGLEESLGLL